MTLQYSSCSNLSYRCNNYTWIPSNPPKPSRFSLPTVMLANIRGSLCTKIDELSVMFNSNRVDIAVLTETWLHSGITDNLMHIPGYCVHKLDRHDCRQGGGIAVCVRQGLLCSLQPQCQHTSFEVLWLLFRDNIMPREVSHFLIGTVYHPPKANNIDMSHYLMDISDTVNRTHSNLGVILLGDFNQLPDSQLKSYPLSQLVTFPTRGNAILDKIFTNIKPWYQPPLVITGVGRSDHDTVLLHPIVEPKQPRRNKQTTYRRSSDPNGKAMIYHHLQHFNWSSLFRMDICQTMVQYFYSVIFSLLDQYLPLIPNPPVTVINHGSPQNFGTSSSAISAHFYWVDTHFTKNSATNPIVRTAASLRKKYYEKKIHSLHSLDPHSWWTKTKQFLHSTTPNPLVGLHYRNTSLTYQSLN